MRGSGSEGVQSLSAEGGGRADMISDTGEPDVTASGAGDQPVLPGFLPSEQSLEGTGLPASAGLSSMY